MNVILLKDINGLGKKGDLVNVKDGYGKNYLIPRKLAILATKGNLKSLENQKKHQKIKEAKTLEEAKEIAKKLETEKLELPVKCGKTGKLYGSITSHDIAEVISKKIRIEIDKRKILLDHPIKQTGNYKVRVKLYQNIYGTININVKPIKTNE